MIDGDPEGASRPRGPGDGTTGRATAAAVRRVTAVVAVATGTAATAGVAGASEAGSAGATAGQGGTLLSVLLQSGPGSAPVVGPTAVLVGAIGVGLLLRVAEKVFGDASTWGSDEPDERAHSVADADVDTSSTGSTAGRSIETSKERIQKEQSASDGGTTQGQGVGTPAARARHEEPGAGEIRHATGTFKTGSSAGTLMVTSVGFEPDLVFFTGGSSGPGEDGFAVGQSLAEGWSHGVAHRTGTGDIKQYAVSVADTGAGSSGGGIREDASLDLPVITEDESTASLWGRVGTTVDEGFQFQVEMPPNHRTGTTVKYHAVSLPDDASASVGTFGFGTEPREGKVDLGVDADYVSLTATTGGRPLTRRADRPVSISHGTVVQPDETPYQSSVGNTVNLVGGGYAARNDRAIHLLHPGQEDIDGRTSMRVTTLGSTMRLRLEDIHEDAPVAFAVYAAIDAGSNPVPATGLVRSPGPEKKSRRRVDTEFTPSAVRLAASAGAVDDRERAIGSGLPMLGWSHNVVTGDPGGLAGSFPLRTVSEEGLSSEDPIGIGIDDDAFIMACMEDMQGERPLVLYTAWPGELEE